MSIETAGGWLIPLGIALTFASLPPALPGGRQLFRATARALGIILAACIASAAAFAVLGLLWPDGGDVRARMVQLGGFATAAGVAAGFGSANPRGAIRVIASATGAFVGALLMPSMQDGWLVQLGALANLGHGAVDLSGLAMVGLVGGGCATACNIIFRVSPAPAALPLRSPVFAAFDGLLLALGAVAVVASLPDARSSGVLTAHLASLGVIVISALGFAGFYGWFTTGRLQAVMLGRALVAALFAGSSAAVFPLSSAPVLGALAALFAIPIGYWLQTRNGIRDGQGAASAVLLPAALGMFWTGLFANGRFLAGWGGVGADAYLNHSGLGVVGWLVGGDIGQFSAQVVFVCAAGGLAMLACASAIVALQQLAPGLTLELDSASQQLDIRRPRAKPGQQTIDKNEPAHSLPTGRAYRVAYPFRARAKRPAQQTREAPTFVVADDTDSAISQDS